ncbi:C2 domain-containing protein [Zychaea mexicana]|uniref:C2 domain-containing protein n=1 Tax=Zychaea mexicana TaxID=64656 RepID=UPI0022FE4AED|nr:C2 domain-containing protein [Zychaea mexicana]KAI9493310.1 C2 domain-containing protein [Zychaea mexicana]
MSQPRLIGELAVVALEAENLPKVAGNLKSFCVFKVANVAKRTKTDTQGNRNPTWDDQVNMPIPHGYNVMSVQVLSEDPQKGDQIVCEGSIDLTKVLGEGESDDWVPLKTRSGQEAGDVYLELTFYSANPPPRRQPTRFGHPRPPHMAGGVSFARPPMPNHFSARPRPPMHSASAPIHVNASPRPPSAGGPPFTGPPPHHMQPGGFATPRPPPPQPMGMPPPPQQPMGTPSHPVAATQVAPMPGTPVTTSSSSSSVAVGGQWRASSKPPPPSFNNSPQPRPLPPQGSPNSPMGAPLLSAPYRPGPPPSRPPSYNNGGKGTYSCVCVQCKIEFLGLQ